MDIDTLMREMDVEFRKFKEHHIGKMDELEKRLDDFELKRNRKGCGDSEPTVAEKHAFVRFLRTGDRSELQTKGMSIGSDPDGGYSVPPLLGNAIMRVAQNYSPLRGLANVQRVSRGNFEQLVATGLSAAEWRSESATRNDTATPTFSAVRPPNGGISSVSPVSNWLLNDSDFDLEKFVVEDIGKRHGLSESAAFITGDGIEKPKGILSSTLVTTSDATRAFGDVQKVHSGSSGAFVADKIIELCYAMKPAYRQNASFLVSSSGLAAIRKLKDGQNNYLFQPTYAAGQPGTLLGYPVYEDDNVPAPSADANALVFADFASAYLIIDIGQPILVRDPITSKGSTKFYVERRVGGHVLDSNAVKILTLST